MNTEPLPDNDSGSKPPSGWFNPGTLLMETVRRAPWMIFALSTAAVAAAGALSLVYFGGDPETCIYASVGVFFGMVLLKAFSVTKMKSRGVNTDKQLEVVLWVAVVFVIAIGAIAVARLAYNAIPAGKGEPLTTAPAELPSTFTIQSHGLSDDFFGPLNDGSRRRDWLEAIDDAARKRFGEDAEAVWVFSEPLTASHGTITAHVYAGTADNIDVRAFRCWKSDGEVVTQSLTQVGKQGSDSVYRFLVPVTKKGDRLLVFLGMSKQTYSNVPREHKFPIRSSEAR